MPGQHPRGGGPRGAGARGEPHLTARRLLLPAALLVLCAADAGRADDQISRLRAENARLQARVRELETENASLRGRAGAAAALEAAAGRRVSARVDEERDVTRLAVEPSRLELTGGNRSRHWITLSAEQGAGTHAGETATIEIDASASNGAYRTVRQLELSVDGTPLMLPVTAHRGEPIVVGPQQQRVGERETVAAAVPADAVARIGAAREVTGRLGPTTFVLNAEQIASFGALARRMAAAP